MSEKTHVSHFDIRLLLYVQHVCLLKNTFLFKGLTGSMVLTTLVNHETLREWDLGVVRSYCEFFLWGVFSACLYFLLLVFHLLWSIRISM